MCAPVRACRTATRGAHCVCQCLSLSVSQCLCFFFVLLTSVCSVFSFSLSLFPWDRAGPSVHRPRPVCFCLPHPRMQNGSLAMTNTLSAHSQLDTNKHREEQTAGQQPPAFGDDIRPTEIPGMIRKMAQWLEFSQKRPLRF